MGVVPLARPDGREQAADGEVKPRLRWWIRQGIEAPSAGMGPPLTGSPGRCAARERRPCGEPHRGPTRPQAAPQGRVLDRMTECVGGFKSRRSASPPSGACQARPARCASRATWWIDLRRRSLRCITSGVKPTAVRDGPGRRAGNDCDAFGSGKEPGQEGQRETVVDNGRRCASSGGGHMTAQWWRAGGSCRWQLTDCKVVVRRIYCTNERRIQAGCGVDGQMGGLWSQWCDFPDR